MGCRFFVILFLLAVSFPVSFAQNRDVTHGDRYYYSMWLAGEKHNDRFGISWLLPGLSDRDILCDMDFSNEDNFIAVFYELTHYIEVHENGFMRLMREWNDWDNASHWDSVYWDMKDMIDSVKVPEYMVVLGDSTVLYLKIFKLNGEYWKNNRLALNTRNPLPRYYEATKGKGMYTLINLYSAKGVTIEKRQRKRLKGALSCELRASQ